MAASTDMLHDGLMKLLHMLYDKDIFGEDVIMKWYNSGVGESSVATALRKQVMYIYNVCEESEAKGRILYFHIYCTVFFSA